MAEHLTFFRSHAGIHVHQIAANVIRAGHACGFCFRTYSLAEDALLFERTASGTLGELNIVPLDLMQRFDPAAYRRFSLEGHDPTFGETGNPGRSRRWEMDGFIPRNGLIKRIRCINYLMWEDYCRFDSPSDKAWHLEWMKNAARSYYLMRCILRGTGADLAYAFRQHSNVWTDPLYIWRPGRRSLLVPAFEAYCDSVGYACVDDLDSPVVRVPDFEPTEALHNELTRLMLK